MTFHMSSFLQEALWGKAKELLELTETWIPVAALRLIPWEAAGKPLRLPGPRFPRLSWGRGVRVAPELSRGPCRSGIYDPESPYEQVPSRGPTEGRGLARDSRALWEACQEPRGDVWVIFPVSDLSFHTCPIERGGQGRLREGQRSLQFAPAREGCPPGTTAEVGAPRRLGPAVQAGGCPTRSIRATWTLRKAVTGGQSVTACQRADSPFGFRLWLRLRLRSGSDSGLGAVHPTPPQRGRPAIPLAARQLLPDLVT